MSNYYNEHDPKAAAWLRELIKAGLIPDGDVDERSITEINPNELYPYTQCHFFAGIGGWSYALQLAGISPTTRLWTGSCPCQPFSSAGKGLAQADERHLWPVFFNLIKECRPDTVFGEQVASAIGKGWLDGISADLESEGYACGAVVLGAHSVSAPHQRQRLYWVAQSSRIGQPERIVGVEAVEECAALSGGAQRYEGSWRDDLANGGESASGLADSDGKQKLSTNPIRFYAESGSSGSHSRVADSSSEGYAGGEWGRETGEEGTPGGHSSECSSNIWSGFCIANCRDGKTRRIPTEPAFQPLAHGVPARVVRLRGYGNAIVPQVAAEFVKAFISTSENTPTNE